MEVHEIANIFPMMNEEDFSNLKKDIFENGFDRERAILLYEDKILDGRNRYKACSDLGITPIFKKYEGDNPLYYVISNNLNRRHLNESQRGIVGSRLATFKHGGDRSKSPIGDLKLEDVSKLLNVGERTISRARELMEKKPEVIARIEKGETTIGREYGELKKEEAETPEWLRYLDVWNFKENTGDGLSNLPPEILKNLVYYYTKEGDLIGDCFAGSGLTYKVAKEMNRKCICSDINPREDFIIKANIDEGFPLEMNELDFLFLDPPYWKQAENMYSKSKEDLGNMKIEDFYASIENFAKELKKKMKE